MTREQMYNDIIEMLTRNVKRLEEIIEMQSRELKYLTSVAPLRKVKTTTPEITKITAELLVPKYCVDIDGSIKTKYLHKIGEALSKVEMP